MTEPAEKADWRDDPGWRLSAYDNQVITERPPDRPADAAELDPSATWATLYDGRRAVAFWSRLP